MHKIYQKGFASAIESKCALEALPGYLEGISDHILTETKLNDPEVREICLQLELDNQQNETKKKRIDRQIASLQTLIQNREDVIETHQLEGFNQSETASQPNGSDQFLSFAIGSTILLLLTLYLILFYSSTGFSMIYGVPATGNGIFNPSIFSVALARGGGAIGFVFLFPVIFLAVGFAMYVALQGSKQIQLQKNNFSTPWLGLIIGITFFMDAILGYKIAKGVYMRDYDMGLHETLWSPSSVFWDINFYLVMILGFAAYLIWGYLLHYVLNHPYRTIRYPVRITHSTIEALQEEINQLTGQLEQLKSESKKIENGNHFRITTAQMVKNGELPYPIQLLLLQNGMQEFMQGYLSYAENVLIHLDDFESKLTQISSTYQQWLTAKIQTLNT